MSRKEDRSIELQRVHGLGRHTRIVSSLAFSPSWPAALSAGHEGALCLWDLDRGRSVRVLEHGASITTAAFADHGKRAVALCDDRNVHVWDVASGAELDVFPVLGPPLDHARAGLGRRYPTCAEFSPDGDHLLIGSHDRIVYLLPVRREARARRFVGHDMPVFGVGFCPDEGLIWSYGQSDPPRAWHIESRRESRRFGDHGMVWHLAVSPDSSTIAVASDRGGIHLWDARSGRAIGRMSMARFFGEDVTSLAFHPTRPWLLSGSQRGRLCVFDVASKKRIATVQAHDGAIERVALSSDGGRALTAGRSRHDIVLWALAGLDGCHGASM